MEPDTHIYREILSQTNPKDLPALCATNALFRSICISPEFWRERYAQNGLFLLTSFPSVEDYVRDFQTCINILNVIDTFLDILKMTVNRNKISWRTSVYSATDYNLPEVDINRIFFMNTTDRLGWSKQIIPGIQGVIREIRRNYLRLDPIRTIIGTAVDFYYSTTDQSWILLFSSENDNVQQYRVKLSEQSARTFLYVQIYRGHLSQLISILSD